MILFLIQTASSEFYHARTLCFLIKFNLTVKIDTSTTSTFELASCVIGFYQDLCECESLSSVPVTDRGRKQVTDKKKMENPPKDSDSERVEKRPQVGARIE